MPERLFTIAYGGGPSVPVAEDVWLEAKSHYADDAEYVFEVWLPRNEFRDALRRVVPKKSHRDKLRKRIATLRSSLEPWEGIEEKAIGFDSLEEFPKPNKILMKRLREEAGIVLRDLDRILDNMNPPTKEDHDDPD